MNKVRAYPVVPYLSVFFEELPCSSSKKAEKGEMPIRTFSSISAGNPQAVDGRTNIARAYPVVPYLSVFFEELPCNSSKKAEKGEMQIRTVASISAGKIWKDPNQ